ncbi:MAG: hypothetical protein ACRCSY_08195 [Cetobacterium sp.]
MIFKIKKWLFNYLFYGYFVNIMIVIITNYFFRDYLINKKEILGSFITCIVIMPLSLGFKGLYYEYKDWYNESGLLGKIIMFLGLGFVLYGVYSRAKISGTFK